MSRTHLHLGKWCETCVRHGRLDAIEAVARQVAAAVPICRLEDDDATYGVCLVHGEIYVDDRCEAYDRGTRDALAAVIETLL